MKPNELSIKEAGAMLRDKKLTSVEITEACFAEIDSRDTELGAFLALNREQAMHAARSADERHRLGKPNGALDGIPVAVKDNILVANMAATAGSKILAEYIAAYDATAVARLKKAGAVIVGKTNMDEFAMGSSTETSAFKLTKNPHDITRVPGGSSGGSAVAVAANMALGALGTDTGGSIREPASFCGVVGLKPTYGRVSRYGAIAMASSLDQIGPFGKSVYDVAAMLEVIEGRDAKDATSARKIETTVPELLAGSVKGKRIGVPKEYFIDGMDPAVEKATRASIDELAKLGAEIVDISLPMTEYALECYYIIMPAEVSSNLSRYDGVRYGTRAEANTLDSMYRKTRGELFGAEPKRRIILGTYVLSSGYYDAYYDKAQRVRTLIKRDFDAAFQKVDAIISPTAPSVAFKLGEKINDPIAMYLSDIYTVSANLAGIPAISLPCGITKGMPIGLQLMGRAFDEATILTVAGALEASRDWKAHQF